MIFKFSESNGTLAPADFTGTVFIHAEFQKNSDFSRIQKEHKPRTGCDNAISDKISLHIFVASELTYTQKISGQFLPGFHSKRYYTMKGLIFLSILVASFTVLVSGKSLSNVFPFRSLFMVRFFLENWDLYIILIKCVPMHYFLM